jgi:membrane fusion protein (multidrug efflux system)
VRATIGNPDKVLLPGMFASVRTRIGSPRTQLTLPQTALTFNPYGDTVFVVEKTGEKDKDGQDALVARQRFVTIGDMRGDQVAIVSGLTANDLVVSSGQIKLKNGTPVHINNSVPLPNDPAPTPSQQ